LENNVDWISTGGGALIEYIANGSLPALEKI
jgi:3-phosphoglycerate kinase